MELILPLEVVKRLKDALKKAGPYEIGGILMGEHIGKNRFMVKDLTIQLRGGGVATFLRTVQNLIGPLSRFFRSTQHDYTRFNYIGEWHSHPLFQPVPSARDRRTMQDIIEDSQVGAHFVVLMIVRLVNSEELEGSLTVYQPGSQEFSGELIWENR